MRALIRGELHPELQQLWGDQNKYIAEVVALFAAIGYDAKAVGTDVLGHERTGAIVANIPADIWEEERRHPIMLGYASDGQVHFLVCAVNPSELHIRFQAPLFMRLRRACVDFVRKNRRTRLHRQLFDFLPIVRKQPYVVLNRSVQVLEANHAEPTIEGTIIGNPVLAAFRLSEGAAILGAILLVLSAALFFYTTDAAPIVESWLPKRFPPGYVQSALERTYSALLVTGFVAFLTVFLRLFELMHNRPIEWDFLIGSRPSRMNHSPQ